MLLIVALMIIPTAEAKRRETPDEIARKTREYKGWEWGAEARFDLVFYDMIYSKVYNDAAKKSYAAQAKFGGNVMLNGGYFITNNWKVGLEIGAQMQYNYSEYLGRTTHTIITTSKVNIINLCLTVTINDTDTIFANSL